MKPAINTAASAADQMLRRLATRAQGLTGADIERAVREARSKARRERRPLSYADVESGLRGNRPPLDYRTRWRFAVHEAGHGVVLHRLDLGSIEGLTVDAETGGFNVLSFNNNFADMLEWYEKALAMLMAGRAAELLVFKKASGGSGGSEESDLARATRMALDIETTLGFGEEPLIYRHHPDATVALVADAGLRQRIHRRLQIALGLATETLMEHRAVFDRLARELFDHQALDGHAVLNILEGPA